jgi:hypothetical protein
MLIAIKHYLPREEGGSAEEEKEMKCLGCVIGNPKHGSGGESL